MTSDRSASAYENTVIASAVAPTALDATRTGNGRARVEFVTGTRPRLEAETRSLLRVRLRAAGLLLCIAVGAFFVRGLFIEEPPIFWERLFTLGGLTVMTGVLVSRVPLTLRQLRGLEAAIFGLIAVYLGFYQYQIVLQKAQQGNPAFELAAIKSCVLYFFGCLLLYGTFIPNTWQRAAWVLVPTALVPFVVMGLLRLRSEAVQETSLQLATFEQVSDNVIMLALGLVAALYGAHIINTLRVEAFEARQMGQYHLKERIGAGGMGEVYLAEHCLLKRPCAIKLIRPGSQTDPDALARFEREVRTTARLSHWNTIDIYDYGRTDDGTFYYVMEYLPGMSLADLVKRHGPLPAARVIHFLRQTCRALHEAHEAGFVHRDIKPANIFAARLGGMCDVAKLLDFGLVKQTADEQSAQQSQVGVFSGSPLYMSPEQAVSATTSDPRSDIYSLGATAYYLLTSRAPFEGNNPVHVMIAHARDPIVPPSKVRDGVPADLERVVLKCLAKKADERYPDVDSLERALAACADAGRWSDDDAARWWETVAEQGATLSADFRPTNDPLAITVVHETTA